jgi:dihydrofolate reductase
MAAAIAEISISLDGLVTGLNPDPDHGLGDGGEALHYWAFDRSDPVVAQVMAEGPLAAGAVVMGRRTFDLIDGPHGWQPDSGYVPGVVFTPPVFVVTHAPPAACRLADQCTFVTDGLAAAIAAAKVAAGAGAGHVAVMGGAEVIRQAIAQRLVDEVRLHLAPVVLGMGTPLFTEPLPVRLLQHTVLVSSHATHLRYRIG